MRGPPFEFYRGKEGLFVLLSERKGGQRRATLNDGGRAQFRDHAITWTLSAQAEQPASLHKSLDQRKREQTKAGICTLLYFFLLLYISILSADPSSITCVSTAHAGCIHKTTPRCNNTPPRLSEALFLPPKRDCVYVCIITHIATWDGIICAGGCVGSRGNGALETFALTGKKHAFFFHDKC